MSGNNEEFTNYYSLLKIQPSAGISEVRAAYLRGAKEHHPDAGGSAAQMQLLSQAYKTLASEKSREAYDKLYELHTGKGDGLDWREHDRAPVRSGKGKVTEDDEFFVDQLYSEYLAKEKDTSSLKGKFKRFFS